MQRCQILRLEPLFREGLVRDCVSQCHHRPVSVNVSDVVQQRIIYNKGRITIRPGGFLEKGKKKKTGC